jgi:hypothetical protein
MARAKLDKLDGLPEVVAAEYAKGTDGAFYLKIDGNLDELGAHPNIGSLVRAKAHEVEQKVAAETAARTAREEADGLRTQMETHLKSTVPKDNLTALEASYKDKLTKAQTEAQGTIDTLNAGLRTVLVDNTANALALRLSKDPKKAALFLPHILPRLSVDFEKNKPVTRVLDAAGKLSALTVDELHAEFVANPLFADVVLGSQASGSSAAESNPAGSASGAKTDLSTASASDLVRRIDAKKRK